MAPPDEFHPDAHSEAKEITGSQQYGQWGQCIAESKQNDRRCHGHAKGPHGKCHSHGGSTPTKDENENVGAKEGNDNAEGNEGGDGAEPTHGVYADNNKMYTEEFDDALRDYADRVFDDLMDRYEERFGDVPFWIETNFREISINSGKRIYADNWSTDKPDQLKTTSPLVDKETEPVPTGEGTVTKVTYSESVPVGTQQRYRREDRQWLKSIGMFEHDPDNQLAEGVQDLASLWGNDLEED